MEIGEATKYLRQFRIALVLACVMLLISLSTGIAQILLRESAYQNCIQISVSSDDTVRLGSYTQAIALEPARSEAYALILDTYCADGFFSKQESEAFLGLYNSNVRKLDQHDSNYGVLHTKLGLAYANGYDGPTPTRLRMALPFLKTAREYLAEDAPQRVTVECYCRIGSYYEDYIWNAGTVAEVSPERMQSLVADIAATLPVFQEDSSSNTYDQLGFYISVCDLFFDQRNVLAATVDHSEVKNILDTIYNSLPDSKILQQEQTKQMLEAIQNNKSNYYDMIERAYARGGS